MVHPFTHLRYLDAIFGTLASTIMPLRYLRERFFEKAQGRRKKRGRDGC
jgi:hypothetical protein